MLTFKLERRGDKFAQLRAKLPSKARVILEKHVEGTISLMRQLSPVDTGFMRDSIERVDMAPLNMGIRIGAYYWPFVNYGTVHQEAQPFVEPAIDAGRKAFIEDLKKALKEL